jgi:hypothetical protein
MDACGDVSPGAQSFWHDTKMVRTFIGLSPRAPRDGDFRHSAAASRQRAEAHLS